MLVEGPSSKRKRENEGRKKKRRAKLALSFLAKMATARGNFVDIRTQAMTARSAAQTASPPKTSRANVVFRGRATNFTIRSS